MHPAVFAAFEEICAAAEVRGPVLEVGAVPGPDSLLRLRALKDAGPKLGIDLAGASDVPGDAVLLGNANDLGRFADGSFAAVLCNSVLEHDPFFWKSLAEIRRVTAPGGLVAIGVPGYAGMGLVEQLRPAPLFASVLRLFARGSAGAAIGASALTLGVHLHPGDYYRFSEQCVREVLMAGLVDCKVRRVLTPPRFVAWGRKP